MQYRKSLRDGRRVFLGGRRVADVTAEPSFAAAIDWTAAGYDREYRPEPDATGPYFTLPRSPDDLREMQQALRRWDMATIATSQGLLMAVTAARRMESTHPVYAERALAYFEQSRRRDIRCAMTITDAKGHRRLAPARQHDPDLYLRVVDVHDDGVVVRGAKMHITSAVNGHELVVMPTKQMKPGEESWAFAGAIPVNSPGVTLVATSVAPPPAEADRYPYSSRYAVPEAMVIFEDVFVPAERVFLCGEIEFSATWAHVLGMWERLGNLSHLVDAADAIVGFAHLIAEANGLARVPHIRQKIGDMTVYATMLAASVEAAISHADVSPEGFVTPNELYTNAAKCYAAENFHALVRNLHDIAGGSVLTAPRLTDLANGDVGPQVAKYMRTMAGVDAEYRLRLFHAIRDYTADAYAGWLAFTTLLGGGGLNAQRAVTMKHYDAERARALAREIAGLPC